VAALHATVEKDGSNRGKHSTTAHHHIEARLQTWNGSITVELRADDTFQIFLGKHSSESMSAGDLVLRGMVGPNGHIELQ
jgi:hypothetical protein